MYAYTLLPPAVRGQVLAEGAGKPLSSYERELRGEGRGAAV